MPDIRSTIEIVDEFSKPLKDLTDGTLDAITGTKALVEALTNESEKLKDAKEDQEKYARQLKFLREEYFSFSKVAEGVINVFKSTASVFSNVFGEMKSVIETAMEDIEITDKMNALWDGAGKVAKDRAYKLANELGQSQRMVTGLAAKAAFEGIGTADFERMMRLADRVAKLKPGETTEGAANTLLDNIKRGHDAGSISSLLGGGQKMERDLRRSGYERALRRGDVSKALEIAEKVAKQAGLTDERYKKASKSLSQNYARIGNTIENVKQRLREIMSRYLEPIMQKIADTLESEKFQRVASIIEGVAKKAMSVVSGVFDFVSEHIYGVGLALGTIFVASKVQPFLGMVTKIVPALLSVKKGILAIGTAMKLAFIANPVGIVIGAIAGLGLAIGKATGKVASLGGALSALAKMVEVLFYNISLIVDEIVNAEERKERIEEFSSKNKDIVDAISETEKEIVERTNLLNNMANAINARHTGMTGEESKEFERLTSERNKLFAERDRLLSEQKQNFTDWENFVKPGFRGMDEVADAAQKANEEFVDDLLGGIDSIINKKDKREQQRHNFFMNWANKQSWMQSYIAKIENGIATNTDKIREYNEREEELRWLKTFSDRQIMSSISNSTSNVQNNTFNRMSDQGYIERARSLSARGTRAKFGSQG